MRRHLSLALALVATVLLAIGLLVGDGLALIYLSIGCSSLALVALVGGLASPNDGERDGQDERGRRTPAR